MAFIHSDVSSRDARACVCVYVYAYQVSLNRLIYINIT